MCRKYLHIVSVYNWKIRVSWSCQLFQNFNDPENRLSMEVMDQDMPREMLRLSQVMATSLTTTSSASASHTSSATRSQSRTKDRNAMKNMMSLWTQPTLSNAKMLWPNTARRHTSRSTIAPLLLVMTPRLSPMDMDMERETLRLKLMLSQDMEAKDTPQDPSANNMLRRCAKRSHNRTRERFQDQCARLLLTQPILKSVRRPSPPSALRPINRSITAQPLLVMTPRQDRLCQGNFLGLCGRGLTKDLHIGGELQMFSWWSGFVKKISVVVVRVEFTVEQRLIHTLYL